MSTSNKGNTIGSRLEEARKKRGVSLREASEATKIRSDYLQKLEDGNFDIGLPPIYVRGFLRNYARYLKLDPAKMMEDYEALQYAQVPRQQRKEPKETLGRVEIGERESSSATPPPFSRNEPQEAPAFDVPQGFWLKIGFLAGGISVLAILVVIIIRLSTTPEPEINPGLQGSGITQVQPTETTGAATMGPQQVTLYALDNVSVIVEQLSNNTRVFSGTLVAGETRSFQVTGAIRINFTNGAALEVEKGGKRYKMGAPGAGRSTLN